MKFHGSKNYVATQDLMLSVNAAITLQRPLLVKGEPGTGKTMLAEEVAQALDLPLLQWHIKSTTKAQQGLYEYDAVSRCATASWATRRCATSRTTSSKACCGRPSPATTPVALLIDEIDKADIEFPNDLLREMDRMEFYCYETRELVRAKHRPLVFITSNNEKELPDAFFAPLLLPLHQVPRRRHHAVHCGRALPQASKKELLSAAMKTFFDVRGFAGPEEKPSTSELLDWLKLLLAEDIPAETLHSKDDKMAVPPWWAHC